MLLTHIYIGFICLLLKPCLTQNQENGTMSKSSTDTSKQAVSTYVEPFQAFRMMVLASSSLTAEEKTNFSLIYTTQLQRRSWSEYVTKSPLNFLLAWLAIVDHVLGLIVLFSKEMLIQPAYSFHRAIMIHEIGSAILRNFRAVGFYYLYYFPVEFSHSLFLNSWKTEMIWGVYILENPLVTQVFALTVIRFLAITIPNRFGILREARTFWVVYFFSLILRIPYQIEYIYFVDFALTVNGTYYIVSAPFPEVLTDLNQYFMVKYEIAESVLLVMFTVAVVVALLHHWRKHSKLVYDKNNNMVKNELKERRLMVTTTSLALINAVPYAVQYLINTLVNQYAVQNGYGLPTAIGNITLAEATLRLTEAIDLTLVCDGLLFCPRPIMAVNFALFMLLSPYFRQIAVSKFRRICGKCLKGGKYNGDGKIGEVKTEKTNQLDGMTRTTSHFMTRF